MEITVDLQLATDAVAVPTCSQFETWVRRAVDHAPEGAAITDPLEVTLRVVDAAESAVLNRTYRRKEGPTNVLAFPFEAPEGVEVPLLGDIVICAPLVVQEAEARGKLPEAHWAHLCIHGCLHLLGYDHECEADAKVMETLEMTLLSELGYANPYEA